MPARVPATAIVAIMSMSEKPPTLWRHARGQFPTMPELGSKRTATMVVCDYEYVLTPLFIGSYKEERRANRRVDARPKSLISLLLVTRLDERIRPLSAEG